MSKLKMYCPSCGSLNLYSGEKPRFCQSCGLSFSGSGEESEQSHEESLDEDSEVEIPDLSGLDVEITKYPNPNETLGQIAGTVSPSKSPKTQRRGSSPKTSKEILAEFQKEAGTRGRNANG
jgi:hypothetical protein